MPRGKPTSIVEQRITLGTFERSWVVDQEKYLKSQVTQAKTAAFVIPLTIGVSFIGLGYGLYAGMCAMADTLPTNPFKNTVEAVKDISGGNESFGPSDQYNNPFGESGFKLHFNRLTDPDWWLSYGNYDGYVDKKDR